MTATTTPTLPTRAEAAAALTAPGAPFELLATTVQGRAVRVFRHAPESLRAVYEAACSDLPFIVYQDERLSFAQAWAAASRIGVVLAQAGVGHGDRVAIAMRNLPEWMLAFTAITAIGAVAVAVNAHWQTDELAYALTDCGAKALLADQERLDRLPPAAARPGLHVLGVRATTLPEGAQHLHHLTDALGPVAMPAANVGPDDLATLLYTSGSTGHPKGVPASHRAILSALLSWELDRSIGEQMAGGAPPAPAEQPGTLLAVPLFHVTGLHASFLSSFRTQRKLVAMYRWDPAVAAQLIDQERLTSVVAPAAMTGDLVRLAQQGGHSLATLQLVGGGGAPRAPEQVRQIGASFGQALPNTGWGMTETNAIGAGIGGEDYLAHPASSGRASLVLDLRVVDELGQPLPAGQRGELQVRGVSVLGGYWRRPEANAQSFDGDWFRTGDVALIDAEGYLFIVDRIKDLIIRGGENIGCGAVEAALLLHPEVREAAVYAVPDERLGEVVGATVHAAPGLTADALRDFLAAHLARFEIPSVLIFSATPLPRTPSGKILKREIRAAALAGR
jgi:long-chain acyl-CoA synthetase